MENFTKNFVNNIFELREDNNPKMVNISCGGGEFRRKNNDKAKANACVKEYKYWSFCFKFLNFM